MFILFTYGVLMLQNQEEEEECASGDGEDIEAFLADLAKVNNSRERASKLFQWLINPIPAKSFFRYRRWHCVCLGVKMCIEHTDSEPHINSK